MKIKIKDKTKKDPFAVPPELKEFPTWKQKILIQEYYVNPERVSFFCEKHKFTR